MKHISRTARALAIDNPGLDRLFSVPDGKNDQKLAAAAREFVREAAKFQADLTGYGLPTNFVAALTDDIEALEDLLTQGSGSRGDQAEATALIDEKIGTAMDIVRRLDAIARNIYRNNPARLAKWTTARHVRRVGRSKPPATEPTT